LACSGFFEFQLLRGLPGSLLPVGLYQRACFGTRPSSVLSTCSSQSCLYLLILSFIENTSNSVVNILRGYLKDQINFLDTNSNDKNLNIFAAVRVEIVVFWVVTPCSPVEDYQRLGGTCCLNFIP
jgi:hypothetical protein